jgi:hypothetical protein
MLNIYQTKSCYVPGEGIQPYLQPLMEHLLDVLKVPTTSVKQKQLAISAIGATCMCFISLSCIIDSVEQCNNINAIKH